MFYSVLLIAVLVGGWIWLYPRPSRRYEQMVEEILESKDVKTFLTLLFGRMLEIRRCPETDFYWTLPGSGNRFLCLLDPATKAWDCHVFSDDRKELISFSKKAGVLRLFVSNLPSEPKTSLSAVLKEGRDSIEVCDHPDGQHGLMRYDWPMSRSLKETLRSRFDGVDQWLNPEILENKP